MAFETEDELEEFLSRPTDEDRAAVAGFNGELLILGAGGKMGPSLARRAHRAAQKAGVPLTVVAVARFTESGLAARLEGEGIHTISIDLLQPGAMNSLPDSQNVIFMAARKFGTTGSAHLTWAMNTFLPGLAAERYRQSRIVAFSTGNVYPLRPVWEGGATEDCPTEPKGEYAQSALGRERMFEYGSQRWGTLAAILRLNYAVEMRYGVLLDIGRAVFEKRPVDLRMAMVNVIWQGDANSVCLRSFAHCQSPPLILNVTGPESLSVAFIARAFAHRFGTEPLFEGEASPTALLSNAAYAHRIFGYPSVAVSQMIEWTAAWITRGGRTLDKPTGFQTRDGRF